MSNVPRLIQSRREQDMVILRMRIPVDMDTAIRKVQELEAGETISTVVRDLIRRGLRSYAQERRKLIQEI